MVMAFTVPKNVNIERAQGEVIQAMRPLPAAFPLKGQRFRNRLAGLPQQFVEPTDRRAGDPYHSD